jgi:site-specific DNA recombinase
VTPHGKPPKVVRCAIYTRKSTSEGLDSDFNTLDAQRESAEHYIKSQAAQGWTVLPARYDDGGFTGGNMERPALTRLIDDIERGEVDVVVVYKVDRLSRSLLDFARLIERFEKRGVGLVAVTQHLDTSTSMGRLTLNVLLSFAQFEREIISERTRDKIAAARRRGKWTGGPLILGYRVDRERRVLEIIPDEAEVVRLAFELYLRTRSIGLTAKRLNARGFKQKKHVSKDGKEAGGRPWDKNTVHRLLRNPLYVGKVRQGAELFVGEHEAIVSLDLFDRVQQGLTERTTGRGPRKGRRPEHLLTGILRCLPCNAAMTTSVVTGKAGRKYRYYRCRKEVAEGCGCPTGLLVADEIEAAVIAQVKLLAREGTLRERIATELAQVDGAKLDTAAEHARLSARLADLNAEAKRLLGAFSGANAGGRLLAGRLGEIETECDQLRRRLGDLQVRMSATARATSDAERVTMLLDAFDEVWDALLAEERRDLLHALIHQVGVDPESGTLRLQPFAPALVESAAPATEPEPAEETR